MTTNLLSDDKSFHCEERSSGSMIRRCRSLSSIDRQIGPLEATRPYTVPPPENGTLQSPSGSTPPRHLALHKEEIFYACQSPASVDDRLLRCSVPAPRPNPRGCYSLRQSASVRLLDDHPGGCRPCLRV